MDQRHTDTEQQVGLQRDINIQPHRLDVSTPEQKRVPPADSCFYWLQLSAVFTSLEALLLKIGEGIEPRFGSHIPGGAELFSPQVSILKCPSRLKLKFSFREVVFPSRNI